MHLNELRDLKRNKEIVICRPDKGSGVVLLDKHDYVNKLASILSDQTKFTRTPSEKDRTEHIEQQISRCLKTLKDGGFITGAMYESIKPIGSSVPRLYGLPKIHKPEIPLRPILSMANSPFH